MEDGKTGWLVPIDQHKDGSGEPKDPELFISDFANKMNEAIASPKLREFGQEGRKRAIDSFSWESIATRTREVYQRALDS